MKLMDELQLNFLALYFWIFSEEDISINKALKEFGLLVYKVPKRKIGGIS